MCVCVCVCVCVCILWSYWVSLTEGQAVERTRSGLWKGQIEYVFSIFAPESSIGPHNPDNRGRTLKLFVKELFFQDSDFVP